MYFICIIQRFEPQGRRFINFLYYYSYLHPAEVGIDSQLLQLVVLQCHAATVAAITKRVRDSGVRGRRRNNKPELLMG